MSISYIELYDFVKSRLKESRFIHSAGVADTAAELAMRFSVRAESARYVGIYHDAYRYDADEGTAEMLERSGMVLYKEEIETPMLLHGPLAAFHMREDCGNDIPESYLIAVRHHTLGSKDMGRLGAVLYISDYIEPGRKHLSAEDRSYILAPDSLEEITIRIMDMQAQYFKREAIKSAEVSEELYSYLKNGGIFQDLK